jgi:hypothetical protein
MFFANSRYVKAGTYSVPGANGEPVLVTRIPQPLKTPLAGYHRRLEGQRLDLIASHYLKDATAFWRLCDAHDAVVPDVLGVSDLVGIPRAGA